MLAGGLQRSFSRHLVFPYNARMMDIAIRNRFRMGIRPHGVTILLAMIAGASAAWSQNPAAVPLHFRESVTLDTDSNVVKKLGTVADYLSEKEWSQAVDVLQDISEKHGQSLIPVAPGQYVNIAVYCNRILAGLPVEGLAVYRERIDPRARQWFEQGRAQRDEALLIKVVHHAFVSSYGDDALLLLGELAWERGHVSAAREYWTQLIPLDRAQAPGEPVPVLRYPDSEFPRAEILARLALCSRLQGNTARADAELRTFRQMHPDAEGTLAGRTGNLAEILTAVREAAQRWNIPAPESTVKTFALNAQRNAILPKAIDVGAKQWSVELPENPYELPQRRPALPDQGPLSYFPVVFGDMVFVNSAESIFAYDVHTGKPAWPSAKDESDAAIYTTVAGRTGALPNLPLVGVPRYTMTISEGRLYARMGAPVTERARHEFRATSELVCLDLVHGQGKLLWHISAERIAVEDEQQSGPQWTFEGSPVVQDGRAYVVLRRTRPNTQLNVACLETETGKILWNRKVVSTVANVDEAYNFASHHLLTLAQNRVFYATDTGAVAALDAADGTLRWVVTYESQSRGDHAALSDHMKQGLLPCLFHQGTLFVAPNDSKHIMALAAETGRIKWRRELPDRIRHLLGVGAGKLILSGNSLWGLDVQTGAVQWRQGFNDPDGYGYGRGLLVDQLVYWPTREEIFIVDQQTGTLRRRVALRALHREYGGNLTIADGMLLIAQPERLVAFGEFGLLREQEEKELSGDPRAALPHWRLAKFELAAGNSDSAAHHFRRAMELATKADRANGRPLADVAAEQGFRVLLETAGEARRRGDLLAAAELLESALELARNPADRLQGRAALAQAHLDNSDPAAAVAVWQSILEEADLADRPFPVEERNEEASTAEQNHFFSLEALPSRSVVPNLIAMAIGRYGRDVYTRQERAARSAWESAIAGGQPFAAESVLAVFPNSAAREEGLLTLARDYRARGDPHGAFRTYRRLIDLNSSSASRRSALTELASLLEQRGYWTPAAETWQQLAAEFPQSPVSVETGAVSAADFVPRHLSQGGYRENSAFRRATTWPVPLARGWRRALNPRAVVCVPDGRPPSADCDGLLIDDRGLHWIDPATGAARWSTNLSFPLLRAFYRDTHLLIATSRAIAAVTYETGDVVWWKPVESFVGGSADDVQLSAQQVALCGDLLHIVIPQLGVWTFDGADGSIVWRLRTRAAGLSPQWSCDEQFLALRSSAHDRAMLLDASSGRLIHVDEAMTPGWRSAPVRIGSNRFAVVTETGRIRSFVARSSAAPWMYAGPFSQANAPPALLTNGLHLAAVIDGDTLLGIEPQTGRRRWSQGLGPEPLAAAHEIACCDGGRLFLASAGILRCFQFEDGRLAWEQYLGSREARWRVLKQGDVLIAFPVNGNRSAANSIIICEAATGKLIQRIRWAEPAGDIDMHVTGRTAAVRVGGQLIGLHPFSPDAASR